MAVKVTYRSNDEDTYKNANGWVFVNKGSFVAIMDGEASVASINASEIAKIELEE